MREVLKKTRIEKGYKKVSDFAELLSISASHYYKIESGIRNPNFELAAKIAQTLDSDVNTLFFDHRLDKTSNTA